jgi:hypothetical protein
MDKLVRSKERQQKHGEVFTPDFLVERMLAMIPEEIWNDPTKTFLEPSCGNGNFIIAIIRKKILHGSTIEQALRTTFGIEILEDNVRECRSRIYDEFLMFETNQRELMEIVQANIKCRDFLLSDTAANVIFDEMKIKTNIAVDVNSNPPRIFPTSIPPQTGGEIVDFVEHEEGDTDIEKLRLYKESHQLQLNDSRGTQIRELPADASGLDQLLMDGYAIAQNGGSRHYLVIKGGKLLKTW